MDQKLFFCLIRLGGAASLPRGRGGVSLSFLVMLDMSSTCSFLMFEVMITALSGGAVLFILGESD